MTAADLLPSNSTRLERDLSRTGNVLPHLGAGAQRIRDAKYNDIPDSVVPWLIYEYGLGEITPYVPDMRQALVEGIQWQRLRGTRKAIEIGLGWIGFDATVEESEASTIRWADFQMGLDQAPPDLEFTENVIQVSRLSAPVRSRLFRIYGGYDHRRFRLDDHQLSGGSWLCDHTGVYVRPDWPQLSFGREFHDDHDILADAVAALSVERTRTDQGWYEDRLILDVNQLSDLAWEPWHMDAERVTVSRGHISVSGPWWQNTDTWDNATWASAFDWSGLLNRIAPPREFAKAGIYLSDGGTLGDTNYCFSARWEEEVGAGAFLLSEADPLTGEHILSEHERRMEWEEWLERLERGHAAAGLAAADAASSLALSREHQRVLPYDDTFRLDQHLLGEWVEVLDRSANSRLHVGSFHATTSAPDAWESVTWLDGASWLSTFGIDEILTASKAGLYLSEGEPLDDTNATFNVALPREIGYESFLLSEADASGVVPQQEFDYLAELGYLEETGQGVIVLSESDPISGMSVLSEHVSDAYLLVDTETSGLHRISEHVQRIVWDVVDERFDRTYQTFVPTPVNSSGILAALERVTQRELPYDDAFTLNLHRLSEFKTAIDELAVTRAHTTSAIGQATHPTGWAEVSWTHATDWIGQLGLELSLQLHRTGLYLSDSDPLSSTHAALGWPESERFDRSYSATATEDRQAIEATQHVRNSYAAAQLFPFIAWDQITWAGADPESWIRGNEDWSSLGWDQTNWLEGTAEVWGARLWAERVAWEATSLFIEIHHETST